MAGGHKAVASFLEALLATYELQKPTVTLFLTCIENVDVKNVLAQVIEIRFGAGRAFQMWRLGQLLVKSATSG